MSAAARCGQRPFRTVGGADVVHVDLTPHAQREASAFARLDGEERARWERFRYDGPRRRFALCRAALRALLCERLGCANERLRFAATEHGKPIAFVDGAAQRAAFNVSHSGAHGLIALAPEGRVGVDVEERAPRRDMETLIRAVLTPDEQALLVGLDERGKIDAFYDLWTIKEALLKAFGIGHAFGMRRIEAPLAMRQGAAGGVFRFPNAPGAEWRVERIGAEEFAAAVALEAV